mmetsp:Transcript_698/g.1368  ORF Transcript_698/g.1368 Transcript_698/m.1368 type:complete len:211 (-) Transcript_698:269-901(-)
MHLFGAHRSKSKSSSSNLVEAHVEGLHHVATHNFLRQDVVQSPVDVVVHVGEEVKLGERGCNYSVDNDVAAHLRSDNGVDTESSVGLGGNDLVLASNGLHAVTNSDVLGTDKVHRLTALSSNNEVGRSCLKGAAHGSLELNEGRLLGVGLVRNEDNVGEGGLASSSSNLDTVTDTDVGHSNLLARLKGHKLSSGEARIVAVITAGSGGRR